MEHRIHSSTCRARIEARIQEDEKLKVTLRNRDARINAGHSRDGARSDQQAETEMQTPKDTKDAELPRFNESARDDGSDGVCQPTIPGDSMDDE